MFPGGRGAGGGGGRGGGGGGRVGGGGGKLPRPGYLTPTLSCVKKDR